MKKSMQIAIVGGLGLVVLAGSTHIWMPASMDECQQDISHADNLWSLPPFHCINHTEFTYDTNAFGQEIIVWDHLHPWMNYIWFIGQGFSGEEANSYLEATKD